MAGLVLDGIRVVDFTHVVAGPLCTMWLGMMGAEVIKVESLRNLDEMRRPRPTLHGGNAELSPTDPRYYDFNSRQKGVFLNKKSIRIDLKQPAGRELAHRLISLSDVVVENFRPGVMERLGLSYEHLRELKPDLILVSISGAGSKGPESSYGGVAGTFAAQGGISHLTGYSDSIPTFFRVSGDLTAGATACLATVAALAHRQRTQEGMHVDVSARECHSSLIGEVFLDYLMNGRNTSRIGNTDSAMVPHNCYRCKGEDRWVSISVAWDEEWKALCQVIGADNLVTDPRFADSFSRWQNQAALDEIIGKWTIGYTDYAVMETLQKAGVAAIPSFSADELFRDPHLRERDSWIVLDQPGQGQRHDLRLPWKSPSTESIRYQRSPLFGEHTAAVLKDVLGLTEEEIGRLEKEQALY